MTIRCLTIAEVAEQLRHLHSDRFLAVPRPHIYRAGRVTAYRVASHGEPTVERTSEGYIITVDVVPGELVVLR